MSKRFAALLTVLTAMMIMAGCAAPAPTVLETLDPQTAVTVSVSNTPFVLFREEPATRADGDHYIHLGPIEVNKTGNYQYFLWVGVWSISGPIDLAAYRHKLEKIVVFADGKPLSLEVFGWTPAAIGTSEATYQKPFDSGSDVYYQVTVEQIKRLSEASEISLQISDANSDIFVLWDEQKVARGDLIEFVKQAY